jgi:Copper type II ascorbate-dependent monooxygenase, C-terminal domain
MRKSFVIATLVAACSSSGSSSGGFIAGFAPPAAPAGAVQIVSPVWKGVPGSTDVVYCSYIANPFGKDVDVVGAVAYQATFGHHVVLEAVADDNPFPPGETHVCTDADMNMARYVAGGGSENGGTLRIPDGLAFRVKAKQRLLIQAHWINTSLKPIDGQAAFNISIKDPSPDRQLAEMFIIYGTQIDVKPHATGQLVTECTMPRDMKLFMLAGHEHEWGSHVKIETVHATTPATVYETDWQREYQSNPPQKYFDLAAPLTFKQGDTVRVTCDWNNTTDSDLLFPKEMCVSVAMAFPATTDVQCGDGVWQESAP